MESIYISGVVSRTIYYGFKGTNVGFPVFYACEHQQGVSSISTDFFLLPKPVRTLIGRNLAHTDPYVVDIAPTIGWNICDKNKNIQNSFIILTNHVVVVVVY